MADQGIMRNAIMIHLWLLKRFALFIVVSECQLAESSSQNQKYFIKVRSHGKYAIMYTCTGWVACIVSLYIIIFMEPY